MDWATVCAWVGGGLMMGAALVVWAKAARDRRRAAVCAVARRLDGRVCLVTGANTGLGLETVAELAARGATVVLACRSPERAAEAVAIVRRRVPGLEGRRLLPMQLDLASLASVERFAAAVAHKLHRLDLLVNNAGVMGAPFALTPDGVEEHFGVNHLGHFHLTNLLLPLLQLSEEGGRVVIVSSALYKRMEAAEWDALSASSRPLDAGRNAAYARSKLANCLHCVELARRNPHLAVYALCPGFVRGTKLGRHFNQALLWLATPFIWYFSISVREGVQTIVHCCLADKSALSSGKLYARCREEPYAPTVTLDNAAQLWSLSEQLVERFHQRTPADS